MTPPPAGHGAAFALAAGAALGYSAIPAAVHLAGGGADPLRFALWANLLLAAAEGCVLRWLPRPVDAPRGQRRLCAHFVGLGSGAAGASGVTQRPFVWLLVTVPAEMVFYMWSAQLAGVYTAAALYVTYPAMMLLIFYLSSRALPASDVPLGSRRLPLGTLLAVTVGAVLVVISQTSRPWALLADPPLPALLLGSAAGLAAAACGAAAIPAKVLLGMRLTSDAVSRLWWATGASILAKLLTAPILLVGMGLSGGWEDWHWPEIAGAATIAATSAAANTLLTLGLLRGSASLSLVSGLDGPLGVWWLLLLGVTLPHSWLYLLGAGILFAGAIRLRSAPVEASTGPDASCA